MLLVVTTPMEGTSRKHFRIVAACVQRIPDGIDEPAADGLASELIRLIEAGVEHVYRTG